MDYFELLQAATGKHYKAVLCQQLDAAKGRHVAAIMACLTTTDPDAAIAELESAAAHIEAIEGAIAAA